MSVSKFAITGYPLGHSMSPFIHERLFGLTGLKAEYVKLEIAPSELESHFDELSRFDGFNITIPHKQSIIKMCSRTEGAAKIYSSVNTVKCGEEIIGYNTDAAGFLKTFEHCGVNLFGSVLLLGAGGAARTAAYECVLGGCSLTIAARPSGLARAKALAGEIMHKIPESSIHICSLEQAKGIYDIIINATPVGMYPNVSACPVGSDVISSCSSVFDLIYNPSETKLLRTAREMGKNVLPGMPMLVWQAAAAHEIWYGASFKKPDMELLISDAGEYMKKHFC